MWKDPTMSHGRLVFEDDFDGPELDREVWLPHYLPAWSSLAETAATYTIADSALHLSIPPDQGLWLPEDHPSPLRVSGVQSGNFSGPVGSTVGQQPLHKGMTVREQQDTFWGWTPQGGYIEVRAWGDISPRSMFAFWMVGLEDRPDRSAEICVAEIFGDAVQPGSAAVGMGLHPFRDPGVIEDFEAVRVDLDPSRPHLYAVDWRQESVDFYVDDRLVRSCGDPPWYPMQLMLAVFDFPDRSNGDDDHLVPTMVVDHVRGYVRDEPERSQPG